MLSYNDSLKILKKTNALIDGHFVLSSGLHSNKYVQCAKLLSFPKYAFKICNSLSKKIKREFPLTNLIISPAVGGIVIGYEIGRQLKVETIFCERAKGKFLLRRGFSIKKNAKVLIVEDVITTGRSSFECSKLVIKAKAQLLGFACIIDRSNDKNLLIKKNKMVSHMKLILQTYKKDKLPSFLKKIPITRPGSRYLK